MNVLTWNTAFGRATPAAVVLARRLAADVVLLQEAEPTGLWDGAIVGARVPNRAWGSWVLVRAGTLEEISVAGYAGWVSGATWRNGHSPDTYVFSVHSPTSSQNEPRRTYVAESAQIVLGICEQVPVGAPL